MLNLFQHLFSMKDPDPDVKSGQGDDRCRESLFNQ
jgi:hypothetical protein